MPDLKILAFEGSCRRAQCDQSWRGIRVCQRTMSKALVRLRNPFEDRVSVPSGQVLFFEAVDGDAAQELWVEVGGFLGEDFARGSQVHHLRDGDWIEKEDGLGAGFVYRGDGCSRIAFVAGVFFGADVFGGDAEALLEDQFVEQDDVEGALRRRHIWKSCGEIGTGPDREDEKSVAAGVEADGERFPAGIGEKRANGISATGCGQTRFRDFEKRGDACGQIFDREACQAEDETVCG